MLSIAPRSNSAPRGWLTALLLLTAPFLLGASDNYLLEIEEDVKRQAATLITNQPQPTSTSTPADAATDRLAAGLERVAFERALRENLPGTYVSYQRLDPARQQQVYESYRNDNRLASISAQIARLVGGK